MLAVNGMDPVRVLMRSRQQSLERLEAAVTPEESEEAELLLALDRGALETLGIVIASDLVDEMDGALVELRGRF